MPRTASPSNVKWAHRAAPTPWPVRFDTPPRDAARASRTTRSALNLGRLGSYRAALVGRPLECLQPFLLARRSAAYLVNLRCSLRQAAARIYAEPAIRAL